MWCTLLAAIGLYAGVIWLYENLRAPVQMVIHSLKELVVPRKLAQRYGKWAVVTGASDGIGKGYAHYLAREGMPVVLVARNHAKLTKVANGIRARHGVETKVVVADFSRGPDIYAHLEKELLPLDIGILVNNVGMSYEVPRPVIELDRETLWDLINVNVASTTVLCHMLAPAMKQRGRGLIVNVSSMTAMLPTPYITTYAATKAFVTSFSEALREELKPFHVEVQTVQPGFVHTNMTDIFVTAMENEIYSKLPLAVEDFMAYAGRTLGKVDRTFGHWSYGLQIAALSLLPESLRISIGTWVAKKVRDAVEASLRKKTRR